MINVNLRSARSGRISERNGRLGAERARGDEKRDGGRLRDRRQRSVAGHRQLTCTANGYDVLNLRRFGS